MTIINRKKNTQMYLVTSALPYANGDIHLGHLVEAVQTDIFVRFQKLVGNHAVYVCADDTHGTPIEVSAMKLKITPQELIERVYNRHIEDYKAFGINFDIFYTTNSNENKYYAEKIYSSLRNKGLIIEKKISQYYCEHDKRFLPDRFIKGICPSCKAEDQYGDVCEICGATYEPTDLKSPYCILCKNPPVLKESVHLYVQLSKYENFLRNYILSSDVLAEEMKNFVKTWIDGGLKDWCISRDGPYFGFEIPDMPNKFFYVWLDAPIGYISSTQKWCNENNKNIDDYWSKKSNTKLIHFIGKDIVYFHTLFWPVMLESAEFKLPSKIFVHGFLNAEGGEKMSKSRGTFIQAKDYLERVKHPQSAEFLRFYFGSKLSNSAEDIDFNTNEFINRINTVLSNNIGNLHHRTVVFCQRYFNNEIPDGPWDNEIAEKIIKEGEAIFSDYNNVMYKSVIERIQELGNVGNKYYQDSKPWELIKNDINKAAIVMVTCANLVRSLGVFLKPIVPSIVKKLEVQYGKEFSWEDHVFSLRKVKLGEPEKLVQPLEKDDLSSLFKKEDLKEKSINKEIDIKEFQNIDLRVAEIKHAEKIEKSDKLLKLQIDIGGELRQIVAGIAQNYSPESIIGKKIIVVANLKSTIIRGIKSEGMLLAAKNKNDLCLIIPEKDISSGSKVS
jgi:methionyl-tRNA synthetase